MKREKNKTLCCKKKMVVFLSLLFYPLQYVLCNVCYAVNFIPLSLKQKASFLLSSKLYVAETLGWGLVIILF